MREIISQQEIEKKWERDAIFESVWDNGIVVSVPCIINILTHQVIDIESCDIVEKEDLDILQSEHILLDGVYYEVFAEDDARLDDVANIFTPTFWY
jgi:hypothetical protein